MHGVPWKSSSVPLHLERFKSDRDFGRLRFNAPVFKYGPRQMSL